MKRRFSRAAWHTSISQPELAAQPRAFGQEKVEKLRNYSELLAGGTRSSAGTRPLAAGNSGQLEAAANAGDTASCSADSELRGQRHAAGSCLQSELDKQLEP